MIELNTGSSSSYPTSMAEMGGKLYFRASGDAGQGLWMSNGTRRNPTDPSLKVALAFLRLPITDYFFEASDSGTINQLWVTDGTIVGTYLLKDATSSGADFYPSYIVNLDGTIYFIVKRTQFPELWQSDGTADGTVLVHTFTNSRRVNSLTATGGALFMKVYDPNTEEELWTSDGSDSGTHLVKDIRVETAHSDLADSHRRQQYTCL